MHRMDDELTHGRKVYVGAFCFCCLHHVFIFCTYCICFAGTPYIPHAPARLLTGLLGVACHFQVI